MSRRNMEEDYSRSRNHIY